MDENFYSVLKIPQGATQRDIKIAYRKLVYAHHPDVNKTGNDEYIKIINVAYETLSDPVKRAAYDNRSKTNYRTSTPNTYSRRTYTSRRRQPQSFYRKTTDQSTYYYSLKTKLMGWGAVVATIFLIWFGIRAMHYYASIYYYDEAIIAESRHKYNQAFNLYVLAMREWGGKNVEASIRIIELNRQMGSYHAMVDNSEIGLSFDPDSTETAQLYYFKGIGFTLTKRFVEAEKAYLNSLTFNFNRDSIYYQLGSIYLNQLYNYTKAEKVYTYLLTDELNNTEDYYNRGTCYQNLGQHSKAIDDFLIILKNDPYNGKILFQLGRSYLALGQTEAACKYLRFAQQQSIKIDPVDFVKACD